MTIFTYGPEHSDNPPTPEKAYRLPHPEPRPGLALRLTRESLGLSAQDIAFFTGHSLRTVQYWEASTYIPDYAETAIRDLEEETSRWEKEIAGKRNIIIYRDGYRKCGQSWIAESWWRSLVGKAVSETGASAVMAINGYAPTAIWQDGDYLRFEIAGPEYEEEFRTGPHGEGLYTWRESGTISLPSREPVMEWKEILGTSQFKLGEDEKLNRHAINKLIKDLEVRDMARAQGLDVRGAAIEIGTRYIGK